MIDHLVSSLLLLAFVAVVALATGATTGLFQPHRTPTVPPDTCPHCGGPALPGHQCGRHVPFWAREEPTP